MKLLFCTHDLDTGGSPRSLSILIEQLRDRHELEIVSFRVANEKRELIHKYRAWNIPVHIFPWTWLPAAYAGVPPMLFQADQENSQRNNVPAIRALASSFDCIIFNGYPATSISGVLPRQIPKFLIAREVPLLTDSGIKRTQIYLKRQIGRAAAIGPVEADILDKFGIPNSIIYNSSKNTPYYQPCIAAPLQFAVFSRFSKRKGLDTLATAINFAQKELRAKNVVIKIYGAEQYPQEVELLLKRFISAAGIGDILQIQPWTNDVDAILANSQCLIRPDLTGSPWGRDIIEAMSLGRAVIATGSCDVFVRPGKTGWLIPPDNPELMAEALIDAASSPNLLETMGKNAFSFAKENFDPHKNAMQMEKEIFKLIESST